MSGYQPLSLDRLLADAKDMGWDWFEAFQARLGGDPRARAALEAQERALTEAAARIFDSQDGRLVLEAMVARTLRRPVFFTQPGLGNDDVVRCGAAREGENALVWWLLRLIGKGRPDFEGGETAKGPDDGRAGGDGGGGGKGRGGRRRRNG